MSKRDKYGNYVNDEGVVIKITQDKNGKDHISFYDGPVDEDHSAVHVNVDYKNGGSWTSHTHDKGHSDPDSGSGDCFLTSACMKAMMDKFEDNCHELTVLRWFRDNYVNKEDIEHYYLVAPRIVSKIDSHKDATSIYQRIYDSVVSVCVCAIEDSDYEKAYTTYRNAVNKLEERFLGN